MDYLLTWKSCYNNNRNLRQKALPRLFFLNLFYWSIVDLQCCVNFYCMEVPQKTKSRVHIGSSNPTPGHISGERSNLKRYMHPNVHSNSTYNSQDMEATWRSMDRWMDKEDVVHIDTGILLSHKKGCNNAICSNKDGPRDDHTKWSKSEGERHIIWCHLYVESKVWRIWTYLRHHLW